MWQYLIVGGVVAAAVVYVVQQVMQRARGCPPTAATDGCSACTGCVLQTGSAPPAGGVQAAAPQARMFEGARRIHVTGNAGAGKTTLARRIGHELGLPVVHLDEFVWKPGWNRMPVDERGRLVDAAVAEGDWVIDGVSAEVRQRAEVIVFLDVPTRVAFWRCIRRAGMLRMRSRPELGSGFPELRALPHALRLCLRFGRHVRPGILGDLEAADQVVHVRDGAELRALMGAVTALRAPI